MGNLSSPKIRNTKTITKDPQQTLWARYRELFPKYKLGFWKKVIFVDFEMVILAIMTMTYGCVTLDYSFTF